MTTHAASLRFLLLLLLVPTSAFAHEMWVLTPELVRIWNNKPLPVTYTSLTTPTLIVLVTALSINALLFLLHRNGANELFPLFRARMHLMQPYTAVVLRICLSWVLLSSAIAMEPRYGNATWSLPTLLAPDILIHKLPPDWQWLRWMEIIISVALICGIYVRAAAVACLVLVALALHLTGMAALAYAPIYAGVALYLFFAGGGSHIIPLPAPDSIKSFTQRLVNKTSINRAQFILRIFAGSNFLFLAIYFKVMQPNLMLAIIEVHKLPILGMRPEVFVLIIAAVEVSIGILVLCGILLRFLSVVMIGAFIFFAICLSEAETLTSHMLYYGVTISFLFNSNGRWREPIAKDIPARILIVGNSLSSVAAAQQLEKLLPNTSNVQVSLITHRLDYQFKAMLPEVVSGAVQPTTLTNPLSKVLERTNIILADVQSIDTINKVLTFKCPDGHENHSSYDELIIATEPEVDRSIENPTHSTDILHLDSVVDALKLKQHLLKHHTRISFTTAADQNATLTVVIHGGGECGSALAMQTHALLRILETDPSMPRVLNRKIILLEHLEDRKKMGNTILKMREKHFRHANISVLDASRVKSLSSDSVCLENGKKIKAHVVINLQTQDIMPPFKDILIQSAPLRQTNLAFEYGDNIWMASHSTSLRTNPQRRISIQLEKGRIAAFNAWASTQSLNTRELERISKSIYECYMGRYTVTTWYGIGLPGLIGWLLNRQRYLSILPSLERKLRILIDWTLDIVFNNDVASLLEYDYRQSIKQVQSLEYSAENDASHSAGSAAIQRKLDTRMKKIA